MIKIYIVGEMLPLEIKAGRAVYNRIKRNILDGYKVLDVKSHVINLIHVTYIEYKEV